MILPNCKLVLSSRGHTFYLLEELCLNCPQTIPTEWGLRPWGSHWRGLSRGVTIFDLQLYSFTLADLLPIDCRGARVEARRLVRRPLSDPGSKGYADGVD